MGYSTSAIYLNLVKLAIVTGSFHNDIVNSQDFILTWHTVKPVHGYHTVASLMLHAFFVSLICMDFGMCFAYHFEFSLLKVSL